MACCCHSLWTQTYYGMFGQESQRSWRDNEGKQLLSDTDCISPPSRAQKASSMHSGWEIRTRRWLGFNIHLCGRVLSSSVLEMQAKLISLVFIMSNSKWVVPWPFVTLVQYLKPLLSKVFPMQALLGPNYYLQPTKVFLNQESSHYATVITRITHFPPTIR